MKAWYEQAFGAHYLKLYAHRDRREAESVLELVFPGSSIDGRLVADVACGAGRYLSALIDKGARVVGLDLSVDLLGEARAKFPGAILVRCDMRRLPLGNASVDWALSLFTSFGYFDSREEHRSLMVELSRVSRTGVVLDVPNPAPLQSKLVEETRRETEDYQVVERRHLEKNPLRVVKKVSLQHKESGKSLEYQERVMLFSEGELREMAVDAGLEVERLWGAYDGSPYRPKESQRLILRLRQSREGR